MKIDRLITVLALALVVFAALGFLLFPSQSQRVLEVTTFACFAFMCLGTPAVLASRNAVRIGIVVFVVVSIACAFHPDPVELLGMVMGAWVGILVLWVMISMLL